MAPSCVLLLGSAVVAGIFLLLFVAFHSARFGARSKPEIRYAAAALT